MSPLVVDKWKPLVMKKSVLPISVCSVHILDVRSNGDICLHDADLFARSTRQLVVHLGTAINCVLTTQTHTHNASIQSLVAFLFDLPVSSLLPQLGPNHSRN